MLGMLLWRCTHMIFVLKWVGGQGLASAGEQLLGSAAGVRSLSRRFLCSHSASTRSMTMYRPRLRRQEAEGPSH